MRTTAPAPGSREWEHYMTASKISAVIGVSPWESPRSLWHRMHGDLTISEDSPATERGTYLEPAALAWWRDTHPGVWRMRRGVWVTSGRYAATLDAVAYRDHRTPVILEAKTSASDDEWGTPGTDEIPPHYWAQAQWQLALTPQASHVELPVIFGGYGFRFELYAVLRDPDVAESLLARAAEFLASLDADDPPELDDHPATYETIRRLHPEIDRGESVEVPALIAEDAAETKDLRKEAEAAERAAKTALLDAMGRAQYATSGGFRVARRSPGRGDSVTLTIL